MLRVLNITPDDQGWLKSKFQMAIRSELWYGDKWISDVASEKKTQLETIYHHSAEMIGKFAAQRSHWSPSCDWAVEGLNVSVI